MLDQRGAECRMFLPLRLSQVCFLTSVVLTFRDLFCWKSGGAGASFVCFFVISRMRSLSALLRCSRRITPLPIDGAQCLRARELEFRRENVSCLSYVRSGDAMRRNGGVAAEKEATTAADSGGWIQSPLDFGSFFDSTTLKPRAMGEASDAAGECVQPLSAQSSNSDKCSSDSGARELNSTRTMFGEGCEETEANLPSEVSKLLMVGPIDVPGNGGPVGNTSEYPVPLTPFSGEKERAIEYERAMVAESAMKSSPAISRSDILFEDEWLMVINKPCGIYSEHVLATIPSLLQASASLAPEAFPQDENVSREETHLHMANRLDRDTSGVMVITKCKKAAGKMSTIFSSRWVEKSYLALCAASPPTWKNLTVESGHGRSRFGAWRVYSKKDVGRGLPAKSSVRNMTTHFMVVAVNKEFVAKRMDSGDIPKGRSWWEDPKAGNMVIAGEEDSNQVLRPFGLESSADTPSEGFFGRDSLSGNGDEVLIRAFPLTGRTHQIRLHCQYIGMPLVGDVKYGGPHTWNGVQYDHHALHAETLSFRHPFTSEKLYLVAPLPQWARDAGIETLQA